VARQGAELTLDISQAGALDQVLGAVSPELVVNCVGLTDLQKCEADPGLAYAINARPAALLASWSNATGGRYLHVSTDHFFGNGGALPHQENERVVLLNEYARTKYAGEAFALTAPNALVIRTSMIGIRGWVLPTFAEWAIGAIIGTAPFQMFEDAYTSSIDAGTLARVMLDLAAAPVSGVLNAAASEVYSKADFVRCLAAALGRSLEHATSASVAGLRPERPVSLGLDISRAQALLTFPLPKLADVVDAVVRAHTERMAR
jgi:dTDP-4-dehydrorhamnose reductase